MDIGNQQGSSQTSESDSELHMSSDSGILEESFDSVCNYELDTLSDVDSSHSVRRGRIFFYQKLIYFYFFPDRSIHNLQVMIIRAFNIIKAYHIPNERNLLKRLSTSGDKLTSCVSRIRKMSGDSKHCKGLPLSEVVEELNKFADLRLAESWDNVGLLIEPVLPQNIRSILLTNDLTEKVMSEALNMKAELIISYHPPIFAALKRITSASWKERIVAQCLKNDIAVYSPHTSWDARLGGVCDWLAGAFNGHYDVAECVALEPSKVLDEKQNLIGIEVTGIPSKVASKILSICLASDREIQYSNHPGERQSYKFDCSRNELDSILDLEDSDVFITSKPQKINQSIGMGRIITVDGLTIGACVSKIKCITKLTHLRLALARGCNADSPVRKIAIVPGSGGSLLRNVKADLYITGEMFHHDILDANHNGASVILTNHSDSERGYLTYVKEKLDTLFSHNVTVSLSTCDKDPLETV